MKKTLVIIALIFSVTLFAQRPGKEKIKAFKTAFITEKLDLSQTEAQKFWPIYNEFEKKLENLRQRERTEINEKIKNKGLENLSEAEANKLINTAISIKEDELAYHKALINNLRGVLPPQKILKLKRTEEQFKRMLLERLKNRRNQDDRPNREDKRGPRNKK
jgi:Glu-tRNA(Gln) amidotransferase subunit E-like FAD-binding protein